jgi:uncharacterized SAM-binding protein YcdF (DUF218 family)
MKKRIKSAVVLLFFILIGGISLGVYQYHSILSWGEQAAPERADVIIVLGAGVWESGPSPALMGRIRLAARLFHEGYAVHLILSGGMGQHPPSEAEAMYHELLRRNVPEEALYLEDQATNTLENIVYSQRLMAENDWQSAIIVTDVFHYKRAHYVADKQGMQISGATVKDGILYQNEALKFRFTLREVLAWYWYRLRLSLPTPALQFFNQSRMIDS